MRWGNHQIDDFTLIIDMGEFQDFYINNAPFGKSPAWMLTGIGKTVKDVYDPWGWNDPETENSKPVYTRFFLTNGQVIYRQMNYKTKNELSIFSVRAFISDPFDYKETALPFYIDDIYMSYLKAANDMSKKVLRNLPFARRGYIFSTPEIQAYYLKQAWYIPNPNYKSSFESLTPEEQKWVNNWSK
jgi:hypothetical protein